MPAETTAHDFAAGLLTFCAEHGDLISNSKLQKLLYYGQGWFLALHDRPLFDDPIEAWIHGPTVPSVFREFSYCGWNPIVFRMPRPIELSDVAQEHVRDVWEAYGSSSAYDLEWHTHREPPWLNARQGLAPDEPCQTVINVEDMRSYFKSLQTNSG